MMPIRDINPTRSTPYVTRALVFLNIAIFLLTFFRPDYPKIVALWGFRPIYLYNFVRLETIFTSMFLHADLHHLIVNMIYLWIFGDNVEDALGHVKFLAAYLFSGIAAATMQSIVEPNSIFPMIGASGAISGVLGIYIVFYPRARIITLVFLGFLITTIVLPAYHYLWFWFLIQLLFGGISLISRIPSNVAYWAHIGGFIAGLAIALITYNTFNVRRKREEYYDLLYDYL